jgi:hypothetical protein
MKSVPLSKLLMALATTGSQVGTVVTVEDQANKVRRSITKKKRPRGTNEFDRNGRSVEPDGTITTFSTWASVGWGDVLRDDCGSTPAEFDEWWTSWDPEQ